MRHVIKFYRLLYEPFWLIPPKVLSRNVPFCQYRQETKVTAALLKKGKPTRPGHEGVGGDEISDAIWRPVSTCFEFEAEDRPSCAQLQKIFSSIDIHDDRPVQNAATRFNAVEHTRASASDLERARSILARIIDVGSSMPPPSQIPEDLQKVLSGLTDSVVKAEAVALAAKKLSPNDTQALVDVLDLVSLLSSLLF
jgi:hypothetical protein